MQEKNCKTIRKVLSEYTWFLMGVTFLMLLVFWGFYMFSNHCYQKNTDHVLTLNSFYNDLDSSSQVLNQYINSGTDADYENVWFLRGVSPHSDICQAPAQPVLPSAGNPAEYMR